MNADCYVYAGGTSFFATSPTGAANTPDKLRLPQAAPAPKLSAFTAFSRLTTAADAFVPFYDTVFMHGCVHGSASPGLFTALRQHVVPVTACASDPGVVTLGSPHPNAGHLLVCIDDVHLATQASQHAARRIIEGIPLVDEQHVQHPRNLFARMHFIGTCAASSPLVAPRLQRHGLCLTVEAPTHQQLHAIYSSYLLSSLTTLSTAGLHDLYRNADAAEGVTTDMGSDGPSESTLSAVMSAARESADKVLRATVLFHTGLRKLNLRDSTESVAVVRVGFKQWLPGLRMVARVVQGLLAQLTPAAVLNPVSVVSVWRHEIERCVMFFSRGICVTCPVGAAMPACFM